MSAPVSVLPGAPPIRGNGETTGETAGETAATERRRSVGGVARRVVGWALVVVLVVLGVLYVLPTRFGGTTSYTVVAGKSMNPTYQTGDLLIGRPRANYEVGDIVIYSVPADQPGAGSGVVHRIVGGDGESGWVLQGDNNDEVDFWRPLDGDIRSGVALHVPKVGYVLHYAASPLLLAVLGGLVVGWVLWPRDDEPHHGRDGEPDAGDDTVIDLRDTVIDLRDDPIIDLRSPGSEPISSPEPTPTRRLVVRFVLRSPQEIT